MPFWGKFLDIETIMLDNNDFTVRPRRRVICTLRILAPFIPASAHVPQFALRLLQLAMLQGKLHNAHASSMPKHKHFSVGNNSLTGEVRSWDIDFRVEVESSQTMQLHWFLGGKGKREGGGALRVHSHNQPRCAIGAQVFICKRHKSAMVCDVLHSPH